MRIIAGRWRGRTLAVPPGDATRPTADRAREALFSMLQSRIGDFAGLAVGDFFAGTGALGLEALSRGAASCVFVEQDRAAIEFLKRNIATLKAEGTDVRAQSVAAFGTAARPLDLLLFDPPYGTGAAGALLERLARLGWVAQGAWAAVETAATETVSANGFAVDAERRLGKAKLTILHAV